MAKKASKVSPNKQAYRAQVKRIKSFVKRAEQRGYSFPTWTVPKEPKRVTKGMIQALKELTPERLYREATYINRETGEVFTGAERRAQEREQERAIRQRKKKEKQNKGTAPNRTDQILSWMEERIADYEEQYSTKKRWGKGGVDLTHWGLDLRALYYSLLAEYGRDEIARRFEAHPEVKEYADVVFTDSKDEAIQLAFNRFIEVMTGGAMTLEEDSDYNDSENY